MHPLQEKFQITVPGKEEADEPWVSAESARSLNGERPLRPTAGLAYLPPGMDIGNQYCSEQNDMPLSLSGSTDVSAQCSSAEAMHEGFVKIEMKGTDDQYSGEHVDHFYGDAGGFCERNNYLDRM